MKEVPGFEDVEKAVIELRGKKNNTRQRSG